MKRSLLGGILILFFLSLISCKQQTIITTTTEIAEITTTIATQQITTTENNDIELFAQSIKDYNIINKAFEYAGEELKITQDWVDKKINKEEVGTKYMELANKVGKDFFAFSIIKEGILKDSGIKEITPEMDKALDLIDSWQEKTKTQYEYMAKNYWGEGAEYEIKADELKNEAKKDYDEFHDLFSTN
jgi:hypothetical protein